MKNGEADLAGTLRQTVAGVVPCYNAGGRVAPVVEKLLHYLQHVIVVDDGSTDGATAPLGALPIEMIRLDDNRGKGHALLTGFRRALENPAVEAVVVLDADGQHNPDELPRLFETFQTQAADLVIGARQFGGGHVPWRSRFGNNLTVSVTRLLLRAQLPDTQSGYRMISRRFAEDILRTVTGGRYETEMEIVVKAIREQYKVMSVPIATIYEAGNASSHFHKVRDSALIYTRLFRACFLRRAQRRSQ